MSDWSDRLFYLDYDSSVALRYHGRRQAFLDTLARVDPALTLIFGAAAFSAVIGGYPKITAGAALIATFASALNLAFGWSERARPHEALVRRWGELRAELIPIEPDNDGALRQLEMKRERIDADSPAQLLALSTMCENEEKTVRRETQLFRVGWLQRSLANICTLPGWRPVPELDQAAPNRPVRALT